MPKLSDLEAGHLAKAKCTVNLEFRAHERVCKFFKCTIDEVWDYMMFLIVGLQNAENHEMRLLDSVDTFPRCARPRHCHC